MKTIQIYFEHDTGEILEIQNWQTWSDSGAMIMRSLNRRERESYRNLKGLLMGDKEIWQVLHPQPLRSNLSSAQASQPPQQPLRRPSTVAQTDDELEKIKIGSCELSKRALLYIIKRVTGIDIEPLKTLSLKDLQALAAYSALPPEGVPVTVVPKLAQV